LPGEGPAGGGAVLAAALAAMLVGAAVSLVAARRGSSRPSAADVLLAPGAAALVVARFYAFDPYYAPTLRRMSEDGAVPDWWVFLLAPPARSRRSRCSDNYGSDWRPPRSSVSSARLPRSRTAPATDAGPRETRVRAASA
jgi:hypothetical protein